MDKKDKNSCVYLSDEDSAFIEDVISLCKKHGKSISHEDGHGGFEIEQYDDFYSEWLRNATSQNTKLNKKVLYGLE